MTISKRTNMDQLKNINEFILKKVFWSIIEIIILFDNSLITFQRH